MAATSSAQVPSSRPMVVRSYDMSGASRATMRRAELTAKDVLGRAQIDSRWRHCRMPSGPDARSLDRCTDVIGVGELALRVARAPQTFSDTNVLGYSQVDPELERGTLATVFADRVHVLAVRLHTDEGLLLGRAIAHEIAHLLLGTGAHSERGLLRGHWSAVGEPIDWLFSPDDAARMRDRLAERFNSALAAADVDPSGP